MNKYNKIQAQLDELSILNLELIVKSHTKKELDDIKEKVPYPDSFPFPTRKNGQKNEEDENHRR
jgi:hypothetical protein